MSDLLRWLVADRVNLWDLLLVSVWAAAASWTVEALGPWGLGQAGVRERRLRALMVGLSVFAVSLLAWALLVRF